MGFSSRYCDLAVGQMAGGQGLRSGWGRPKGRTQHCVQLVSGALSHGHDDGHSFPFSAEVNLTFRGPCIVIYSHNKTNEMH